MPTHIHEANMRRQIRIRQRSRFLDIAAFCVLQARPHTMPQQHVHCRLRLVAFEPLTKVNCAKRMILRPGGAPEPPPFREPNRTRHECDSDRDK